MPPRTSSNSPQKRTYDAVVIGSGPNGLAAAITLAQAGAAVLVIEGKETPGGGTRTQPLTLPGFLHDVCSAVHPMGLASPFLRSLPLQQHGLAWLHPELPLAHPLDHGQAAILSRSLAETVEQLGADGNRYQRLFAPLIESAGDLLQDVLGPLKIPRHPFTLARFGLRALRSASALAQSHFTQPQTRALFAGNAAHAILPLEQPLSAAIGLMLMTMGHAVGWPFARGGSQAIADALVRYLQTLGGELVCGWPVVTLDELPKAEVILCDVAPRALAGLAGNSLPEGYRRALLRYRHGPGAFKIDWALSEPIPWTAAACRRAGTVHVGGTLEEVAAAERACWQGKASAQPFVLVSQPSLFDPSRAPQDKHVGWAYCHVPPGGAENMTEYLENQIERFAPGFRDCILARHTMAPADFENYNANYVGGDIIGGVTDWRQLFTRPVIRINPYQTPRKNLFLCSASTPPGAGVHGMCGYHAARAALKRLR